MISRIRGKLLRRELGSVEVMTGGGVAYEIEVPLPVFERLPREGEDVELRTFQVVREDDITLYGFLEESSRRVFGRLLTASGVGPKLALAMLSRLSPEGLVRAILEKDIHALRQVPGLGTKKAERLVLELSDNLDDLALEAVGPRADGRLAEEALGALVALGYNAAQAGQAVRAALEAHPELDRAALIKAALARLGGK